MSLGESPGGGGAEVVPAGGGGTGVVLVGGGGAVGVFFSVLLGVGAFG